MSSIIIKNGLIINASTEKKSDILVNNGIIIEIGNNLEKPDSQTEVIDADSLYVFPGFVDPHVHMELPVGNTISSDDFESGTAAAIAGGTTTIIDFVTPQRGESLIDSLFARKELAKKSVCDYGFHMSITSVNENTEKEIEKCIVGEGITSFKTYLAYKNTIGLEDSELIKMMDIAKRLNFLITIHCEHGDIISYLQNKFISEGKTGPEFHGKSRPSIVEGEAIHRVLTMAKIIDIPIYIVHVSTEEGIDEIKKAQSNGQIVFAETCPHYLLLDEKEYDRPGFDGAAYVMSPPLRSKIHQKALWDAIKNNIIQTIATDHCPFNFHGQKDIGQNDFTKIPNGVAGVENRFSLIYTYGVLENKITINKLIDLSSTLPAKIFGLFPRKGIIEIGADADIVIWDPNGSKIISAKTHHQRCDTNIYEGFKLQGEPYIIIHNGKIVFKSGDLKVNRGNGGYLFRRREDLKSLKIKSGN